MKNFNSKRKQDKIEPDEVRNYVLKVPLNRSEREFLDAVRGQYSRAETMRFLLQDSPPKSVPEANKILCIELSKAAANLNQIAHHLNGGEVVEIEKISEGLSVFRAKLLGAQL